MSTHMQVFGDNPILPDEADDLKKHVTKCAQRYSDLARVIYRLQIMLWIFQGLLFPLVIYIILKLNGKV